MGQCKTYMRNKASSGMSSGGGKEDLRDES